MEHLFYCQTSLLVAIALYSLSQLSLSQIIWEGETQRRRERGGNQLQRRIVCFRMLYNRHRSRLLIC